MDVMSLFRKRRSYSAAMTSDDTKEQSVIIVWGVVPRNAQARRVATGKTAATAAPRLLHAWRPALPVEAARSCRHLCAAGKHREGHAFGEEDGGERCESRYAKGHLRDRQRRYEVDHLRLAAHELGRPRPPGRQSLP